MKLRFTRCLTLATVGILAAGVGHSRGDAHGNPHAGYEVWAADQSNSVPGQPLGTRGGLIWIWDSVDIARQLAGGPKAVPVGCDGNNAAHASSGPCDLLQLFPADLSEHDAAGVATGAQLGDRIGFGRLHGLVPDPQSRYLTVNVFAPNGGYVGIIDARRKEAIALFRVTDLNVGRSVHMSFWSADGSAIVVANLNGKTLERIDIERNPSGKILQARFDRGASLGLGKDLSVGESATVFLGKNHRNRPMLGRVVGAYAAAGFGNLTARGECKENGCADGPDAALGGRPNNVIICPIASERDNVYVTLGGGGLIVANLVATPMTIVGEYGNQVVNGAGCGGVQSGNQMWLNAGVSASAAGGTQSAFTTYVLPDNAFGWTPNAPNLPLPQTAYKDPTNTTHLGNLDGAAAANLTGQIPGITTRRDAHGAAATVDGVYIHNVDRIRNVVEVFDTRDLGRRHTYDLTSADGRGNGVGACLAASVTDDPNLPRNDPAPDLLEATPDGRYLAVALRGPAPVSVNHSAQGSCPGVGIVALDAGGARGRLVGVLRTTNTVDDGATTSPGGVNYAGRERSDVHSAAVIAK